jgi:ferric-dicitrate binding protein FerR (iron transport regulator)
MLVPNKQADQYAQETQAAVQLLQASLHAKKPIFHITKSENTSKTKPISFPVRLRQIAASLVILIAVSILAYSLINSYLTTVIYQTDYGKTQKITLPDGSIVTLNSNSSLRVPKSWEQGEAREVWLNGEAFFEVQKQENGEKQSLTKFTVHSANVDIEVLGTQFNVWNRKNHVAVVLNEGKVKLSIKGKNTPTQTVEMLPNDIVEVANNQVNFTKKQVKTRLYTSWKAQEFVFENTSLADVAQKIEEVYGLKVTFQNKKMELETITGVIPCKSEQLFFDVLSTTLGMKIIKKEQSKEVMFSREK